MTLRWTAMLVALIALGATVGGCGSDDDESANSDAKSLQTSSLSEGQYLKQANTACRSKSANYEEEIVAFVRARPEVQSESEIALAGVKAVVLPINEAQVAAVRKLGAPEGDEDEVEAALEAQEKAIAEATGAKRFANVAASHRYFVDATKMLEDYGLKDCVYAP